MGVCLAACHIYAVDLRDDKKRLRFHPFHPIRLLQGDATRDLYKYTIGNVTYGNRDWVRTLRFLENDHFTFIIEICSGITCGRVLNGEFYTQRF